MGPLGRLLRLLALASAVAATGMACSSPKDTAQGARDAGAPDSGLDAEADTSVPPDVPCVLHDAGPAEFPWNDTLAVGKPLPNFGFDVFAPGGPPALHPEPMARYYRPCDPPGLLVIRATAAWCGTCRWDAAHTQEWLSHDLAARLQLLDVLVADAENLPPELEAMQAWASLVEANHAFRVARDGSFALGRVTPTAVPLPLYVLVDTKTMNVIQALSNPDPDALDALLRSALAQLDGTTPPQSKAPTLVDGLFFRNQWDLVKDMTVPQAPPADPTNTVADTPAAAALGKELFSDTSLSPTGTVSCASCHDRARGLGDGAPQSVEGIAHLDRNAPSITLASFNRWQFWDGRADSLWMQALGPFENAKEVGGSRLFVAHGIFDRYRPEYEALFGAMPDLSDLARFPAAGQPSTPAWLSMAPADQTAATRIFVNVGKSIAAFERTFRATESRFDHYVAGDPTALSAGEKEGLRDFFSAGCAQCHYGPRLTDDTFHDVRFGTGRQDGLADRGRTDGIKLLATSEFHAGSVWSDAPLLSRLPALRRHSTTLGAFKTPTLRAIPGSAPYGHGGSLATLEAVVTLHKHPGLDPSDPGATGNLEPWVAPFSDAAELAIPSFLKALSADPIVP